MKHVKETGAKSFEEKRLQIKERSGLGVSLALVIRWYQLTCIFSLKTHSNMFLKYK